MQEAGDSSRQLPRDAHDLLSLHRLPAHIPSAQIGAGT